MNEITPVGKSSRRFINLLFVVFAILFCLFSQVLFSDVLAKGKKSAAVRTHSAKRLVNKVIRHRSTKVISTAKRAKVSVKAENTAASAMTMSMLGLKNTRLTIKDHRLSGAVYYLASGHGGPDPGAIGKYGKFALAEDEYAYDVTIRLARDLMEHGATVYMIIRDPNDGIRNDKILKLDHDEVTYPNQSIPLNQVSRLRQCTDAINKLHRKHKGAYQRMVTIHVDSRSAGETIDVFFYHHQNSAVGKRLARNIHRSFNSCYKRCQPNRVYLGSVSERSELYVVRNSHPPTVFIELGNIRNQKDQRRFLLAGNRQALADWIYQGMRADYAAR